MCPNTTSFFNKKYINTGKKTALMNEKRVESEVDTYEIIL